MMLDRTNYLRNANQYHDVTHFIPSSVTKTKKKWTKITLKDVNKLEPTSNAGGNKKLHNCFLKQWIL